MKASEFITEGLTHPCIVVDVQPEYIEDGPWFDTGLQIINFLNGRQGPILMFVNAEQDGLTADSIPQIKEWWEDYGFEEDNWNRVTIVDKGFGYFRAYMEQGASDATVIKMIRTLYTKKLNDARDLEYDEYVAIMGDDSLIDEVFAINWTSVAQLKRFNGAYIMGGGRNECLREVELLMNAFNVRYKRIDDLVYG